MTDEMMNVSHPSPLRLQTRARVRAAYARGEVHVSVVCEVFQRQAPRKRLASFRNRPPQRRPGRSITLGRILIQTGAAKGFQIVFTLSILFDRHLVCDPGE